jgi:hypothetical protein
MARVSGPCLLGPESAPGRLDDRGETAYARVGYRMTGDSAGVGRARGSSVARGLLIAVSRITPRGVCGRPTGALVSPIAWIGADSITARLQHQPASSLATATATTLERRPRRPSRCAQRRCRRIPACSARARTSGRHPRCRPSNARLARTGCRWCQAASTNSRRAWELPALVIGPRAWRAPAWDSVGTRPS